MRALWTIFWTVWLALVAVSEASPLVVGFERFYAVEDAASVQGGRLLFNELGCINCHGGVTGLPVRGGPQIQGVTQRANVSWIRTFLEMPDAAHTGSTMPAMFSGRPASDREAVIQYLASLASSKVQSKPKTSRHVNAQRGRELFHTVGCVACHAPDPAFSPGESIPVASDFTHASIALPDLRFKTSLSPLAEFLLDPSKVRPDGRMPKLLFEEEDAFDVAGYLLGFEGSDSKLATPLESLLPDPTQIEHGRILVAEMRCAACHALPSKVSTVHLSENSGDRGCLAVTPPVDVPHYALSDLQRSALRRYVKALQGPASFNTGSIAMEKSASALLTLQALNCFACHERDGTGGPDAARRMYFQGDANLGDTGKLPPPLTGIGRKLRPEWLVKVLAGGHRVRPYLKTRMPVYGSATGHLAEALALADAREGRWLPGGDDTAGRQLLGTQGGMGCITCHRWGDKPSLGIQALDLSTIAQRLQPDWLYDYLVNPALYRPGTLMPSFWPEGVSSNPGVLGGDTAHQIASIYSFAASANGIPAGFPENSSGEFELRPKGRPIVQRTFFKDVGTYAILVGFSEGVHLAFDGLTAQPALAWKGRFFDAYNTWFSRFAPFETPLGESVVQWERAKNTPSLHFDGYRLDAGGVPTFLSTQAGCVVEDRFVPFEGGLSRLVRWRDGASGGPVIHHPLGVDVQEIPLEQAASEWSSRRFIYQWK